MPVIIDAGQVPPRWAERNLRSGSVAENSGVAENSESLRVAFINNMPDAALEDTEMQFFELLEAAAADVTVRVHLYSLSGVPRGERGLEHVQHFYSSSDSLFGQPFDGVIMTGTEPRQSNLRTEPYWSAMANVLDWAESNTTSTVLSCLAAHAGVLHSDGISRHPLGDKQFGVFTFGKTGEHELTNGTGQHVRFPHSRWNEVGSGELTECGYTILTQSTEGGVDTFVKKKKRSLFVHFQGHPEYEAQTLLKEYRRDIKRFTRGERDTYPSMPKGYFDAVSTKLVADFRDAVLADRQEKIMEGFPESDLIRTLEKTWHSSASAIYRNWLGYLAAKRKDTRKVSAVVRVHETIPHRTNAVPAGQNE